MFSMSKKKFCILILAFISLVFSFNMVKSTYAKYVTSNDKTTDVNLAKWDILVNGEYIKSSKTLSATLTPNFVASSYTTDGYLAPGTQAYFDVIVDNTYVDVDYNYIALCPMLSTFERLFDKENAERGNIVPIRSNLYKVVRLSDQNDHQLPRSKK